MSSRTIPVLVLFALSAACGGKTDVIPDGGGDTDSGGADGGTIDAAPGPDCPAQAPTNGGACSKEGLQCEYGGDPRWVCNALSTCTNGAWTSVKGSDMDCPTPAANPPPCPATFEDAQNAGACSDLGTTCDYSTSSATRFCSCFTFGGPVQLDGGGAAWQCGQAFNPTCPTARPRVGAPCAQPDTYCAYDVCGEPSGLSVQCDGDTGTWVTSPGDVCAGAQ